VGKRCKERRTELRWQKLLQESVNVEMNDGGFFQLWHGTSVNQYGSPTLVAQRAPQQRPEFILYYLAGAMSLKMDSTSWQAVSPEIIHERQEFLRQDHISRPSSCRSVIVDGKETGVRYWVGDRGVRTSRLPYPVPPLHVPLSPASRPFPCCSRPL